MPDLTLLVKEASKDPEAAERLDRALRRIPAVNAVNVDLERGRVAVSFTGGGSKLAEIEHAATEAGFELEESPGAEQVSKDS